MSSWQNTPETNASHVETLKLILEKVQSPADLNDHPWAKGLLVSEAIHKNPALSRLGPGECLLAAIGNLFIQMMPSLPPRRGLRLDTRWAEFGTLAARYFAPLQFGSPFPPTLRDAWGRIDQSILLFVFGRSEDELTKEEIARYRLVGHEPDVAPISTLSDWHRKGLEHLASLIIARESHLKKKENEHLPALETASRKRQSRPARRVFFLLFIVLCLLLLSLGTIKAYRIYVIAMKVKTDAYTLAQILPSSFDSSRLRQTAEQLPVLDADLKLLEVEARPVLWLSPWLSWIPNYGGDLVQAGNLLDLAQHLTQSAEKADQALLPILNTATDPTNNSSKLDLPGLANLLSQSQSQLREAQAEFQLARAVRNKLDVNALSPQVRVLITQKLDPGMAWMGDGLSLAISLPSVLGAGQDGPKTYLLLVQNEDELRATGGFITAVGKLVLDQGHVVDLSFEDSGSLDNWSMPYPMAPWQLSQYMDSPVLILRDANWFPDFPTSVLYVKELYAYTHQNTVNGVIGFDQQMLIMLLQTLGPLNVTGAPYPITADNVVGYMRSSKSPQSGGQPLSPGGDYKDFIRTIAYAMVQKVLSDNPSEWRSLSQTLLKALDERHLVLQIDNPDMEAVLARRNWDGALLSDGGDFLSVIDTNVGFNKTTAVVATSLAYDVDLTNLSAPVGNLVVSHTNHASADIPCAPRGGNVEVTVEEYYPIDRCYWDYMRIYAPQGSNLISATPQSIPAAWMILNQPVAPHVDLLDEGELGLQGFGTMLVVPGGQTLNTTMRFALPASRILLKDSATHSFTYDLTVRKQPGTLAIPLTLRIHLPNNAVLTSTSLGETAQGNNLLFQTNLNTDVYVEVIFSTP